MKFIKLNSIIINIKYKNNNNTDIVGNSKNIDMFK